MAEMQLFLFFILFSLCVCHSPEDVPSFLRRTHPSKQFPEIQENRFSGIPEETIKSLVEVKMRMTSQRKSRFWTEPQEIDHLGWFTVRWEGISIPYNHSRDYIALYLVPDGQTDVAPHDYLDMLDLMSEGGTWPRGIPNVRGSYFLRYFRFDGKFFIELSRTNFVQMKKGKAEAVHVHLSISAQEGSLGSPNMHLLWTSGSKEQAVRYASSPSLLVARRHSSVKVVVSNDPKKYTAEMMCEEPATIRSAQYYIDVGHLHGVELVDLEPNQQYFYQVGNEFQGWSDIYTFKSAPISHASATTRMAIFGDMGVQFKGLDDNSHNEFGGASSTLERLIKDIDTYDTVLHIGDISYAWSHGYVWEMFMSDIEPISRQIPYMVNIGNHEHDYSNSDVLDPATGTKPFHPEGYNYNGHDSGGECSIPTIYRFGVPTNGNNVWWYSFNQGNIHVLMFSTEHDYRPGSAQYKWMANDLSSVDRSRTPWVIVAGHRPPYASRDIPNEFRTSILLRESIEDLLVDNAVDLGVWGHYHSYERTCAVRFGKCVGGEGTTLFDIYQPEDKRGAPVHVVVGTGGFGKTVVGTAYDFEWSVFRGTEYGYLWLEAREHELNAKWLRAFDGYILDEFTIHKE